MDPKLDEALCRDFPNVFRDRSARKEDSCMYWGLDCGDGWEPLIRRIAVAFEAWILTQPEEERPKYKAAQVKEKFGGLNFYTAGHPDTVDKVIRGAQEESYRTCEVCGAPGRPRKGGWVKTLCDAHAAERKEQSG